MKPLGSKAFSLVEVTMAIGIAALALLPVLGLLPTGLQSLKSANDQAAAANAISMIASTIRGATTSGSNNLDYAAAYGEANNTIGYTLGSGSDTVLTFTNLGCDGLPSSSGPSAYAKLAAYVKITPPPTPTELGTAFISVAWPDSASYNSGSAKWSNAQGFVSSSIRFLPR